jgi:drug/metabolite transporter (DMT)-like permease
MGLLNGALPYSLITWGEQFVDSSIAAILIAGVPIFTVIFAQFFLSDERLTWVSAAGIALGFLGVAVLIGPDALAGARNNLLGDLAIVGAAASYGAAFIWTRRRERRTDPLVATTGQLVMASMWMLPITLLVEQPWRLHLEPTTNTVAAVASLVTLAVVGTSFAYLLYYWLVARIGATQTSLVTYISPFTSVVWGALFLGERLTGAAIAGFALILVGLALINGFVGQVLRRLAPTSIGR